jgi:hypothetical protein
VDPREGRLVDLGVTLVDTVGGAAIAEEMLDAGGDIATLDAVGGARRALEALDHLSGIAGDQIGILRIAFVGAAPAIVLRHGHGRAERPVDAGRGGLDGGRLADPADQLRVASGAEADVVREDSGTDDVGVAVDRIDAEDQRDLEIAGPVFHRHGAESARGVDPVLPRRLVVLADRARIAAGENRTQRIFAQIVGPDRADVALDHLPDLLLDSHPGDQRVHELLGLGIDQPLAPGGRPVFRNRNGLACLGRCRILARQRGRCAKDGGRQQQLHAPTHASLLDCYRYLDNQSGEDC